VEASAGRGEEQICMPVSLADELLFWLDRPEYKAYLERINSCVNECYSQLVNTRKVLPECLSSVMETESMRPHNSKASDSLQARHT